MESLRHSPLETTLQASGAEFAERRGCRLAERFGAVEAEYNAVRQVAGVFDRTDRAFLAARGPDTKSLLHRLLSNDIQGLEPGQGRYATLLTPQGHMVAEMTVLALDDEFLLETDAARLEPLVAALDRYIIADDVTLEERSNALTALAVEGPAAGKLLRAAGTTALPAQELEHNEARLGGADVRIVRLSETGEEGFRLVVAKELAQKLWNALTAARQEVSWQPVGFAAYNILRTEAGLPQVGAELSERTLPPEVGLEARAISYNKGCYPGQEIIERIRSRGHVNRKLTGLLLGAEAASGDRLLADGKEVGEITTAVYSPRLGRPIALAYVRAEYRQPGTRLALPSGATAEVVDLPFYRRATP